MPILKIPSVLQKAAGLDGDALAADGVTVLEALHDGCRKHAALLPHLFHGNAELKHHFLLSVNDSQVAVDTPVSKDDVIEIMIATSGGSALALSAAEIARYSRHLTLPQVGVKGQVALRNAKVLIVGAGGLGAPIGLYLAAMGIGRIGIVDHDVVEASNLQRQVIHSLCDVGRPKVESACDRMRAINDAITVVPYNLSLDRENALTLIADYDVVVDGTDNFPTRYLINDACVIAGKPYLYGAILGFDGQASVLNHADAPCYRCLFPEPPSTELAPNCEINGVLGVLPGLIGLIQATEVVKVLLGIGESLTGRLLSYDALSMSFREIRVRRNPHCRMCSATADRRALTEYEKNCANESAYADSGPMVSEITPQEAQTLLSNPAHGVELIDVREWVETQICVLDGARNIPISSLARELAKLPKDRVYILYCKVGGRSTRAATIMLRQGFTKVYSIRGGILRWARDIDDRIPIY